MIDQILDYFRQTGRKVPDLLPAVIFAQTELGETFDAIMRSGMVGEGWLRNHERDNQIEVELADTYMMILLAASAMDVDLDTVLSEKMLRKGWEPEPRLLAAWKQAFKEEGGGGPEASTGSRRALWDSCMSCLNHEQASTEQMEALESDLRRQQKDLDALLDAVEKLEPSE